MPATTTVAVYCRIGKDPSRLEVGVNRQRQDCLALAKDLWPEGEVRVFTLVTHFRWEDRRECHAASQLAAAGLRPLLLPAALACAHSQRP